MPQVRRGGGGDAEAARAGRLARGDSSSTDHGPDDDREHLHAVWKGNLERTNYAVF